MSPLSRGTTGGGGILAETKVRQLKINILRYDPERDKSPHFQEFAVPAGRGTTVLDSLLHIKENLDSTLTFRASCRMGICGSCGVFINGFPYLACHTQLEELHSGKLVIRPLPNMPVIKDLVVDLTSFFGAHKTIKPYLIRRDTEEVENPTAEFVQRPEQLEEILQFTTCIKCGLCIAACPTAASDKRYLGPQALAQCYRYCADNRDEGEKERLPILDAGHGIWHCHLAGACSEACPKGVDPALAIQLMKRRLISQALGFKGKKKRSP